MSWIYGNNDDNTLTGTLDDDYIFGDSVTILSRDWPAMTLF